MTLEYIGVFLGPGWAVEDGEPGMDFIEERVEKSGIRVGGVK